MKRTYLNANFIYPSPTILGYQEVEAGNVTGYFDVTGKDMPDGFLSCTVTSAAKTPSWAHDVLAPNISDATLSEIEALPDAKQLEIVAEIERLVTEAKNNA